MLTIYKSISCVFLRKNSFLCSGSWIIINGSKFIFTKIKKINTDVKKSRIQNSKFLFNVFFQLLCLIIMRAITFFAIILRRFWNRPFCRLMLCFKLLLFFSLFAYNCYFFSLYGRHSQVYLFIAIISKIGSP